MTNTPPVDKETGEILESREGSMPEFVALARVRHYHELGLQIKPLETSRRRDGDLLKAYLQAHGGPLEDGETGLVARLQGRQAEGDLDVASMPDAMIVALGKQGLLKGDMKALRLMQGKFIEAHDALRYVTPGTTTTALVVERKETP